ncbi:hypothetical protein TNIN_485031 [Trichonephila inaurata madagascariensis]|uniref:Uncharacterized protein n=1 Tax=Trichonephila inaurata madagascariensis TaxID=2747483 RepID=A0A8X6XCR1_9ARAC|nr:hypothetical protein TNIN_485031 [Trichonephila inaurata madagascariensis]
MSVRIYCLHLATGGTIRTRSGSEPTIYRGEPGNDRGDQTEPGEKGERERKNRRREKTWSEEDGWTMDCNLVPS